VYVVDLCNNFQNGPVDDDVENVDTSNIEEPPVSPSVADPKKAKAEQKRLEKEEREREKKQKEDEKRQLKEQERISKENARKEKSTAPSRKQERDEKKLSGIASFMSPRRQGVKPKNTIRGRVLLLDGSEIEVDIEVDIFFILLTSSLLVKRNIHRLAFEYSEANVLSFAF